MDFSNLSIGLAFPKGELHPELEIRQQLTGEDPKSVVREMWRRHYGQIICATVNEAQQKLQTAMQLSFDKIDRVVVAGGSSRLPFVKDKEEITLVLPSMVEKNSIHIGSDIGEAVAYGIACECREQAKREQTLVVDKLSPCILNDLHIAFKRTRRDGFEIPRVWSNGTETKGGQLLSAPFETEDLTRVMKSISPSRWRTVCSITSVTLRFAMIPCCTVKLSERYFLDRQSEEGLTKV